MKKLYRIALVFPQFPDGYAPFSACGAERCEAKTRMGLACEAYLQWSVGVEISFPGSSDLLVGAHTAQAC